MTFQIRQTKWDGWSNCLSADIYEWLKGENDSEFFLRENNWSMTWLLIFDHLEILQAWRIYEDNVINGGFVKIGILLKNNEWCNIT